MYLPQEDNLIAGASREGLLPPGLNTAYPPSSLRADQSPECYGLDLSVDGKIGKGTIPSGTSRIAKTVTIACTDIGGGSAVPFLLYYGRLWNITGLTNAGTSTTLKIGAPDTEAAWLTQSTDFSFTEDATAVPILALVPLGTSGDMAVIKTSGSYIVENVYDPRGTQFFRRSDIIQELSAASVTNVTELDGTLYASNANGLIAYKDGKTTDLTALVRDSKTGFTTLNLESDYINKRIIATTDSSNGFVYDVPTEKLFKYVASTFRYTTRQWHHPQWFKTAIDGVKFVIVHGDTSDGTLTYQTRIDENAWSDTKTAYLTYSDGIYTVVDEGLTENGAGHRFQVRVTDISSNKYIQEIRVIGESWNE